MHVHRGVFLVVPWSWIERRCSLFRRFPAADQPSQVPSGGPARRPTPLTQVAGLVMMVPPGLTRASRVSCEQVFDAGHSRSRFPESARCGEASHLAPLETLTPEQARTRVRTMREAMKQAIPQIAEVRNLEAVGPHGPIPMRLYRNKTAAATASQPCLVYYHGGGWLFGDLDSHDILCRQLARVGMRRDRGRLPAGPRQQFPAAVDDAHAALTWIRASAQSEDQHVAPGWRWAATAPVATGPPWWRSRRAAKISTRRIDLSSSWYIPRPTGPSSSDLVQPATATATPHHGSPWIGSMTTIIANPDDNTTRRASPLLRANHFPSLPPAFVLTAGGDPLCDEGGKTRAPWKSTASRSSTAITTARCTPSSE